MKYERISSRSELRRQNRVEGLKQLGVALTSILLGCVAVVMLAGGLLLGFAPLLASAYGLVWVFARMETVNEWNKQVEQRL